MTRTHALRARLARRAGAQRERGSSSIQMVMLLPALFAVMFLGMQGALWYHARSVAIAAAQEGARKAGAQNSSVGAGISDASSFIADAGGSGVLDGAHVTGSRSGTTATITVSGTSMSVIPGWTITVRQSATVPVERLTR
ncbi:TadE-like protein [Branchiibius hedensis]|uniref:TadE-like protein n=1 Tax=Branchiibius hedensis TaxID=672460 RepID=A0A2Y9C6W3_9MICO|nr:TadE family protein [Branchiibius hedensis]PWJ23256.1 TadE-like protein [Branchiibius hedensis]PWJ23367.1 TadE-like protein [Branchiibius hedensis]SSA58945.1 TadE-like protein [Branchiibius hedensis]SSA59055.1 TadE-like protein [Branchiibius hedensis]